MRAKKTSYARRACHHGRGVFGSNAASHSCDGAGTENLARSGEPIRLSLRSEPNLASTISNAFPCVLSQAKDPNTSKILASPSEPNRLSRVREASARARASEKKAREQRRKGGRVCSLLSGLHLHSSTRRPQVLPLGLCSPCVLPMTSSVLPLLIPSFFVKSLIRFIGLVHSVLRI